MSETEGMAPQAWFALGTLLFLGLTAIISGVVWINKRLADERAYSEEERKKYSSKSEQDRKDLYKVITNNKDRCSDVDKRVGILESEQANATKKMDTIEKKVDEVEKTLGEIRIAQREDKLEIMGAIHKISK